MSNPNYCVITVANCDPKFMNKALDLTEGFKKEIELKANPISIRYGVMSTGQYAGAIAFFFRTMHRWLTLKNLLVSIRRLMIIKHYSIAVMPQ